MSGAQLKPRWEQIRNKPDVLLVSDMQAALIAIATANSGGPPAGGAAFIIDPSTGDIVFSAITSSSSYAASLDFSDARNSMYIPLLFEDF